MTPPLVTIITPTYNHERFIGACLDSVLAQDYDTWEQIVVDDGSTDRTRQIVSSYRDPRIRFVAQEHAGIWNLGRIYNRALAMARGEVVAVLEGDDFWPGDKLGRQTESFEDPSVVFSWGRATYVDEGGRLLEVRPRRMDVYPGNDPAAMLRLLLSENVIPASTAMARRSALETIGGFHQPYYAPFVDYPTWLRLSLLGTQAPLDAVLGYYRQHSAQVSSSMAVNMIQALECSLEFWNGLPDEWKSRLQLDGDELRNVHLRRAGIAYFWQGKLASGRGDWEDAIRWFDRAIGFAPAGTNAKAFLGLGYAAVVREVRCRRASPPPVAGSHL